MGSLPYKTDSIELRGYLLDSHKVLTLIAEKYIKTAVLPERLWSSPCSEAIFVPLKVMSIFRLS
jgi:hypothetical protein